MGTAVTDASQVRPGCLELEGPTADLAIQHDGKLPVHRVVELRQTRHRHSLLGVRRPHRNAHLGGRQSDNSS